MPSSPVDEKAGVAAAPVKPKRQVEKPVPRKPDRDLLLDDRQKIGAIAQPPAAPVVELAPKVRKRTIMGRYVYGDEPKPGERWKRLLRRTR